MGTKYSYGRLLSLDFLKSKEKVVEKLKQEGFGVLTEIDVKSTLKKKLDVDTDNYVILGACNPPFAYKALQNEEEVGLLLPCNIIVMSKNKGTYISTILPTSAMSMINNPELKNIAKKVEEKLKKVIDEV